MVLCLFECPLCLCLYIFCHDWHVKLSFIFVIIIYLPQTKTSCLLLKTVGPMCYSAFQCLHHVLITRLELLIFFLDIWIKSVKLMSCKTYFFYIDWDIQVFWWQGRNMFSINETTYLTEKKTLKQKCVPYLMVNINCKCYE